jgi:putative ABC transport system permease protein
VAGHERARTAIRAARGEICPRPRDGSGPRRAGRASSPQEYQQRRKASPGMTARDVRIIQANLEGLERLSARKTLHPNKVLPKPAHGVPELYGVRPAYRASHGMKTLEGRFFDQQEDAASAAVCVLGETAKIEVLGYGSALGRYIKVDDTWLRVIGVLERRLASASQSSEVQVQDLNNAVFIPFDTFQYRFSSSSYLKDDLDGIDIELQPGADSMKAARVVTAILNSTHHDGFAARTPASAASKASTNGFRTASCLCD